MNLDKYFAELGVNNTTDKVISITHNFVSNVEKYRSEPSEKWKKKIFLQKKYYYKGTPEFDKLWKKITSNRFTSFDEPFCYFPIMTIGDESNVKYIKIPLKNYESYHINYVDNENRKYFDADYCSKYAIATSY